MEWEYKIEVLEYLEKDFTERIEELNKQGKEEWELVTIDNGCYATFKRPVKYYDTPKVSSSSMYY